MTTAGQVLLNATFEVSGGIVGRVIPSSFRVVQQAMPLVKNIEGTIDQTTNFGKTGIISSNGPVSNVKVIALKNGIVYDFDTTDENGQYTLHLEDGVYDIKIESHGYERVIKNYQHTGGITPYREIITSGQIQGQAYDIIAFSQVDSSTGEELPDDGDRLVSGIMLGEHGQPIENAEIVVAESDTHKIYAFVKTDFEGRYSFAIKRQDYDIIIRSPIHHAKKLKGFSFKDLDSNGFMPQVIENALMFRQGGEWVWISN